jgi:hypothetical protein
MKNVECRMQNAEFRVWGVESEINNENSIGLNKYKFFKYIAKKRSLLLLQGKAIIFE